MNNRIIQELPAIKSTFLQKNHRLIFFGVWLLLGLIQACLTELQDDEAYYWVYSRYLDWGYFDHPPMIALIIKTGYAVFHSELGVRLIPVIMNLFSLLIIERLISEKNQRLFYTIVLSISMLQLGGFWAVPDTPLIFFTALFFWAYKLFIQKPSWKNTMMLALSSLLMLYSKYHGVLVIIFTLLSDLSLLKRYKTYLIGMIILAGFLPHLFWQYQQGWPTIQYQLFERNADSYRPVFTLDYIFGQVLVSGPIAGFILVPAAFLYKTRDKLEKALFFTMIGFYCFFLLSTYRGYVEANWTAPVILPLIVLSHHFLNKKKKWESILVKLLPLTLLLTAFGRIVMVADIIPLTVIRSMYHSWNKWPGQMKEKTKGLPVVFNNSYQRASKYWFYSGQTTYSPSYYKERRTNYNFWPLEDSLLGKNVYILDIYGLQQFPDSMATPIGWVGYRFDSSYSSFGKAIINCDQEKIKIKENTSFTLSGKIEMPSIYADYLTNHKLLKTKVIIGIFKKNEWIKDLDAPFTLREILDKPFSMEVSAPLSRGNYYLLFSIQSGNNIPTQNSRKINITVE